MPETEILTVGGLNLRNPTLCTTGAPAGMEGSGKTQHGDPEIAMRSRQLICLAMCGNALLAAATGFAASPPALIECKPSRVYNCVANTHDCDSMPVITDQGAYVLKINLQGKRAETFEAEKKVAETRIDRIQRKDQLLFLYGFELDENDRVSAHSWNAIINLQNGRLTVTRVADGVGAVMHGGCDLEKGGAP